ncbi:amino acid--tRNA ligase-related protein [Nannocystis pusilla]|uniref:amino acid--tRNA ligase-related protein n=1 Tax=Nannocystis pusilla TaxID=889268 RepID=UPI003BF2EBD7
MAAELGGLAWPARVQIWDAALAAVRGYFRDQGLREVSTPVRVPAVAVEPFIDPIAAPPGLLATSPELAMKRLLVRGSGPIFQIAHVFRRAEIGERHSEEFHLVEWYRLGADLDPLLADVEALVDRVFAATGSNGHVPKTWQRARFLEVVTATCGAALRGDEDPGQLLAALPPALADEVARAADMSADAEPRARTLLAWTAFFTAWSDMFFEPWLKGHEGTHLVDFPAPLAALAITDPVRPWLARRAECHVGGLEIANGYVELRDADEQRRRFAAVNELRRVHGAPALPIDEDFLAELPGLPPCAGIALGLDRLITLAACRTRLADVSLALGGG